MKTLRVVVVVALVAGGAYGMKGCLSKADPDVRLAGRFDAMCKIAGDNVATPERGVKKLGAYLGAHLGDITGELGETIAMIEKIRDDDRHDDRARVARDRILGTLTGCHQEWGDFAEAVAGNPAASRLVDHAGERLSRTLEILFGGDGLGKLGQLPARLERDIDRLVR
jgi:hypothetical protein